MPRGLTSFLAVMLVVPAVLLGASGTASASSDLGGSWVSDSKRDSGFGYSLTLRPDGRQAATYTGALWFSYPDGRTGSYVRVKAKSRDARLRIVAQDGTFDRSGRTLRATVDRRTGALTFVNCQQRLRLVMSWALDSDCVLRR